jgi:hypothetical protein
VFPRLLDEQARDPAASPVHDARPQDEGSDII